jgi:hypothetical protein
VQIISYGDTFFCTLIIEQVFCTQSVGFPFGWQQAVRYLVQ